MNGPYSLNVLSKHYNPWADPDLLQQGGGDKSFHDLLVKRQIAHLSLLHFEENDDRMIQVAIMDNAVDTYRLFKATRP
ncbi:MAG: hypothetical protein QFB87_00340 [Patescibacteria group bacterium]|nr:hypothetical protein [Patescibacteria group bacterium]